MFPGPSGILPEIWEGFWVWWLDGSRDFGLTEQYSYLEQPDCNNHYARYVPLLMEGPW